MHFILYIVFSISKNAKLHLKRWAVVVAAVFLVLLNIVVHQLCATKTTTTTTGKMIDY